ncbi:hypothetical protein CYLTODRAFT_487893 [Cylindrobasidium torrendii FP15055 ss-10]|uniref:Uncharacterized protein n=1 Tax=Cylindrobasidium torrendii FP15055 ss-10 TaxID=1314674 RepID=A0A0D7BKF9_9AGAR|nr:hypothetical protein CYLTODRAFT_487893 [Cylindrobasidium torrendii FP15055 ss-10]
MSTSTYSADQCPICVPPIIDDQLNDPRLRALLLTNGAILSVESSEWTAKLYELHILQTNLEHAIRTLQSSQNQVENAIYKLNSVTGHQPIRSLPNDALDTIFQFCTLGSHELLDKDSLDAESTPWVLTRVSRRWRAAAFANPRLWAEVFLNVHRRQFSNSSVIKRMEDVFRLSGACFLTIELQGHKTYNEVDNDNEALFRILRSASGRVRTLYVDALPLSTDRIASWVFPHLHYLSLGSTYFAEYDWFGDTPSLKVLEIRDVAISGLSVNWKALSHCHIAESDVTDVLDAFVDSNVQVLRIHELTYEGSGLNTESTLNLPSLTTLLVSGTDWFLVKVVIECIRAPLLHTLKMSVMPSTDGGVLQLPVLRSTDSLTTVFIAYSYITLPVLSADIVAVLTSDMMAQVTELYLGLPYRPMAAAFAEMRQSNHACLPSLKTLYILLWVV